MQAKIAIDARIVPGSPGGIEQFLLGLCHGLGQLDDGEEEFYFIVNKNMTEWISPYIKGRCNILTTKNDYPGYRINLASRFRKTYEFYKQAKGFFPKNKYRLYVSDGLIEEKKIDLIHFILPLSCFRTEVKTMYHVHDLQHLYLPEYFSKYEMKYREFYYRHYCKCSNMIDVSSKYVKDTIIEKYNIKEDKIVVIYGASTTSAYNVATDNTYRQYVIDKYNLPNKFIFYPAQTWEHKNHDGLIKALHLIKTKTNININVICTGKQTQNFSNIQKLLHSLKMEGQVSFLGFIPESDIKIIYKLSDFVIFPTKYEGLGLPLLESFQEGVPVACSAVTCLHEYAQDAALLFNPYDINDIADAILLLYSNDKVKNELSEKGRQRAIEFTWKKAAIALRECYRKIITFNPLSE
jgi:glycosyltransferase involved in cell wall biosynthesis